MIKNYLKKNYHWIVATMVMGSMGGYVTFSPALLCVCIAYVLGVWVGRSGI